MKCLVKNKSSEISTPELQGASYILCLNSVPEKEIYQLYQKVNKLNFSTKIYYTNNKFDKLVKLPLTRLNYLNIEELSFLKNEKKNNFKSLIKINGELLRIIRTSPCSLYVKKNMKLEEISLKQAKKEKFILIYKKDLNDFAQEYQQALFTSLQGLHQQNNQIKVLKSTHLLLQEIGLSAETIFITDQLINSISQNFKVEGIFNQFQKENFIAGHSLMTAYLCVHMAKSLPEFKGCEQDLVFSALFHDLFSPDEETNLSEPELKEKFANHPQRVASFFENSRFYNKNVHNIFLYHHEHPNGKGLFKADNSSIKKISKLFITAHEFSVNFYHLRNSQESLKCLEDFKTNQDYKTYYEQLDYLVKNSTLSKKAAS